jgi:hypothetical protein
VDWNFSPRSGKFEFAEFYQSEFKSRGANQKWVAVAAEGQERDGREARDPDRDLAGQVVVVVMILSSCKPKRPVGAVISATVRH